jgi:cell division septum initiation protein DivIVA
VSAAAKALRSAEEIAREMVSEPVSVDFPNGFCDWSGEIASERAWFMTKDDAFVSLDAIRLGIQLAITQARADGAAALAGQRIRDLAGRIRGLAQEYAGRYVDAATEDDVASYRTAMQHLRWAYRIAVKGVEVDQRMRERIEKMRDDTYGPDDPVSKAADELESIVRECGEEKR